MFKNTNYGYFKRGHDFHSSRKDSNSVIKGCVSTSERYFWGIAFHGASKSDSSVFRKFRED